MVLTNNSELHSLMLKNIKILNFLFDNSDLHSLKNIEHTKNVIKNRKLGITKNIKSKLKFEFGFALTIY